MAKRLVRDLALDKALQIEIKSTLADWNKSYVQWCAISDEEINKNKVKLTATYDMDWQKILSGNIYDSPRRHAFIIGGIYKGVIGMVIYSKAFQKCDVAGNRVEESE